MIRYSVYLLAVILGLCSAAMAVEEVAVIYGGQATLPANAVLGDWGFIPRENPPASLAPEKIPGFTRAYGVRISTLGRYQGARFDFTTPLDTTAFIGAKNTYLELYIRPVPEDKATVSPTMDPTGMPMPPTTVTPMPGAMPPPGMMNPDGTFTPGQPDETQLPEGIRPEVKLPLTIPMPAMKSLRFTFFTEKGQGLLVVTPDQFYPKEEVERRWIRIDIPFTLLNSTLPVGGKMTRMLITSDEPAQFMVGRIAVVRDADPLAVKTVIFPAFLEAGQRIYFGARVEPGLAHYETTWSFDSKNKPGTDATGDRVTYTYDTEGTYVVTCTVKDVNGGKEPVAVQMEVKVSPPQGD